ncbi:MAG: laminin G domain-containing protein [Planctomycetota bacterium]|nr:laminin G domain-containing protein [Planctomycetota bacterium]
MNSSWRISVPLALLALGAGLQCARAGEPFSWAQPHAEVTPEGDLKWQPKPFVFEPGASVKYIDYEGGDDAAAGTKEAPWKHHPWDPNAAGAAKACKGVHTYVFKRGVTYRGELRGAESGEPGNPIRLTSDPAWGQGEALICGSELVKNWKQGEAHAKIPDGAKVWHADLDFVPRNVWLVEGEKITRLNLARMPNWKVSNLEDVMSEWWEWEQPEWWKETNNKFTVKGKQMHLGVDKKRLTQDADFYVGAIVRSEWGIVMGTPFPSKVEAFDAQRKGLAFQGPWWGDSGKLLTANRYYLEDKPHYLDEPGEFWFEKKGEGGRLYARMPGDADPNAARIEAAKRFDLLSDPTAADAPDRMDIFPAEKKETMNVKGASHLVVSGLTFRFTNTWWDLEFPSWMHKNVENACVRLRGTSDDVTISSCAFEHVSRGVSVEAIHGRCAIGSVTVQDCSFRFTDHGAVHLSKGSGARFERARVLRNNFEMVGMRPNRQSSGHNLDIGFAVEQEVAGNIMRRCYGSGIFVHGGKGGGPGEAPLSRVLIHHNKVVDSLLAANDWGGIETWQGGPFYLYSNISGNPGGYWHWNGSRGKNARLGFAFYHDGGFKNYNFNNIAWGKSSDPSSPLCAEVAFYEAVPTVLNYFYQNTIFRFKQASNWSPRGGYHNWVGNVFEDISSYVFAHGKLKEDKGEAVNEHPHETNAFARNVFSKTSKEFAIFEQAGRKHESFASMQAALVERKAMAASLGVEASSPVLKDGANLDFRPASGSAAIDAGARFFVPWSLYGVVGEWNFVPAGNDPGTILDEHWYMTDYDLDRHDYHSKHPRFPLKVAGAGAGDYETGPLEDWAQGALKLNGKDRFACAAHAEMTKPLPVKQTTGKGKNQKTVDETYEGARLKTPDIHKSNFLIEAYVKLEAAPAAGVLVRKRAERGFALELADGALVFSVNTGAGTHQVKSTAKFNNGAWRHVIAECDRASKKLTLYVDGKKDAEGEGPDAEASLDNGGDLCVGGTPQGECLAGAVDFLRIAHGTLKDAKTSIEELYAWQFDGPFLRDFTGRKPQGKGRDAGALEGE